MKKHRGRRGPVRLLFIQTQAEMAGAQEISRLLGDGLAREERGGEPEFEIHHLFFYRKTSAFDRWDNVHFCLEDSPKGPIAIVRFLWRLVAMIRRIQPDVVLTFQHYGNIFGAPAGRLAGVPVVIANHVSAPATISRPTRIIDRLLGLVGAYDVITVNSNETWRNYHEYPERYSKRLVHVPHGFEDKSVDTGRQEARTSFGLPHGVCMMGSVARLHPLKQLDTAIAVLPRRHALHLAIAGQGPDEQRLRAIAEDLGVADRVHFVGDLPPQKIGLFLAGLNVFVFPSAAETFGLAAVEAAQAGVPVVANELPVLREVLSVDGEPCALFVDARDVDDFAAKIDMVLQDHRQAAHMVALGRRLAGRYSVENMVQDYARLIREAIGRDNGRPAQSDQPSAPAFHSPRIAGAPTPGPTRVLLVIGQPQLARWVLWLADALRRRAGAEVRIRLVDDGEADTALATLLSLERILVARHRPGGADRITPAELGDAPRDTTAFHPEVVVDLTEAAAAQAPAGGVLLRPLYDGHPGETALASALFFRGTPLIAIRRIEPGQGEGRVVASGTASLEAAAGIGGGMEAVASRVITLLVKALSQPDAAAAPLAPLPARAITRRDVLLRTGKDVARAAVRAAYRLCCHPSHWRVGWRFVEAGADVWSRRDLGGARWNVLADPVDHFYADPFPLRRAGKDFLFFEDLDHKTGKGIISVVAFDDAGRPGPAMPVLDEPWHLSYPFLIERGGEVFMIPESAANRDIALYRAVDFPMRWERHAVLVDGVEAADATIVEHDGLLYLFAVVRDGIGGYSDTLAIWWAQDLFGPWTPHAGNPVLVDDRAARPAGNFVRRDGMLYRPVQDCRRAYGAALGFMKVTRLDRDGFAQRGEGAVTGGGPWPGKRLHTLNCNGRLEAIDGFTLRPKFKPAADLVDRWYRPPSA